MLESAVAPVADGACDVAAYDGFDVAAARAVDRVEREPATINALVVATKDADRTAVEAALRKIARWEPRLTITGAMATARFCLASDEFDIVIACPGGCPQAASDIVAMVAGECPVLLVLPTAAAHSDPTGLAEGAAVIARTALDSRRLAAAIDGALVRHARRMSACGPS